MGILEKLKSILTPKSTAAGTVNNPIVVPVQKTYGTHGRLEIEDLEIEMPLYDVVGNNAQAVVDAVNSAAFFQVWKQNVIADHVSQGKFRNLIKAQPGKTKAVIRYQDGTQESYRCLVSQLGHIKTLASTNVLYDWKWEQFYDKNPDGLTIYTCFGLRKDNVQDVTLTYWEKE